MNSAFQISGTIHFLSSILPYTNADWEKLSIFLDHLVDKLPKIEDEDLAKGILATIDMDSYRVEKQAMLTIQLSDTDAEIAPAPTDASGWKPEPELDRLSNIVNEFNKLWGSVEWEDKDRIAQMIAVDIPEKVAADKAYQNAVRNSDKENAKVEFDKALGRVMTSLVNTHTQFYKQYADDPDFKRFLSEQVFRSTYSRPPAP